MAYNHGVKISEVPTSILPPVQVEAAIPFIVGTARERQKFCVHGIIGARQTGASNEHEHQTQFS